jgi:homoserine dehydrogenase
MSPEAYNAFTKHAVFTPGNYFYNGIGHVCVDYGKVLKIGYRGIITETQAAMDRLDVADPDYISRMNFLTAVIESCEAVIEYARRYSRLARDMAKVEKCKYRRAELEKIARRNRCGLYYEASCVGGVPIIRTLLDGVQANKIQSMMGIVNGTTNYILTKMTYEGADYADALKEAQRLGYAEANPTADVDGFDSMYKLSILSSMAFHTKIPYTKIFREGISQIDVKDIVFGRENCSKQLFSCRLSVGTCDSDNR